MELRQLEALRAIVETGSFTLAARQLNVTQSALSHQIKNLEHEIGETLLIRSKPKVYPSPAGRQVMASAERILAEMDRLKEGFGTDQVNEITGALRVAASTLGIVYLYGHLYESFIVTYPRIELILTAAETPTDGVKQVVSRTADVAFAPFPLEAATVALETVTLGRVEHVFIVAPKHPLATSGTVSIEQLRQFPFVRYVPGAGTRRASDDLFLPAGGYPPILMESNDTEFIKRIVQMGLGVALMPYVTIHRASEVGELAILRLGGTVLTQEFGLVHRRGLRMRALEVFKNLCIAQRHSIPGLLDERDGGPGPALAAERVPDSAPQGRRPASPRPKASRARAR